MEIIEVIVDGQFSDLISFEFYLLAMECQKIEIYSQLFVRSVFCILQFSL